MLVAPIISLIGYHVHTNETRVISFTIFCCLCVDMIILPLFIGMNIVEHTDTKLSKSLFKGKYTDFNGTWFADVGF